MGLLWPVLNRVEISHRNFFLLALCYSSCNLCLQNKNNDYTAINIECLKCAIKFKKQASRYHSISASLLDWRLRAMTSRLNLPRICASSEFFYIKLLKCLLWGYKRLKRTQNIYSYIMKRWLPLHWWILPHVGISMDESCLTSICIPSRDNIHQYQCNNLIMPYLSYNHET